MGENLKKTTAELILIILLLFGLLRVLSIKENIENLSLEVNSLSGELSKISNTNLGEITHNQDLISAFNGTFCSNLGDHRVVVNFMKNGELEIVYKSLSGKKVIAKHQTRLKNEMGEITVKTKNFEGIDYEYVLSDIVVKDEQVTFFNTGGGRFTRENCQ